MFKLHIYIHFRYNNEGTKVYNPRRYTSVVYCCMYIANCMRYVYGMRESTGKYTEAGLAKTQL